VSGSIALYPINSPSTPHGHASSTRAVPRIDAEAEQEQTKECKQVYAKRAGIEGTISQGVRVMGLRRSRSIGQEKMHLQHVATAAALNQVRSKVWFGGLPRAQTRRSAFVRLYDAA
jgi:transposase